MSAPAPPSSSSTAAQASLSSAALSQTTYGAQRLLEKQHEWQGVAMLKEASGRMLQQVESLAREGDVMADGGKAIGSVLANWPNVFRIISLCAQTPASAPNGAAPPEEPEEPEVLPRLVRLQVDGLQSAEGRAEA
ncbi:hypothetical protein CALVIDRAFT_490033 [Calocera viscosa TUFC12733]|uniref:DASH complex subunit DAD2 n=1 Tax=Calocera viscosa (strain TUFC12733) TaxID=1330018 RepID=A0A167GNB6_CALVF|nr:hypothetical protein CALVIDRAFT_490033 [Calocera viscosa TUFC12733]